MIAHFNFERPALCVLHTPEVILVSQKLEERKSKMAAEETVCLSQHEVSCGLVLQPLY